jgi:tetratricopeptide (TPR) repeat protein
MVLLRQARFVEAGRELNAAQAVLDVQGDTDLLTQEIHRANRAAVLVARAEWSAAFPIATQANTRMEAELGTKHPLLAGPLCLLGAIHRDQSLYAKGEAYYFRALSIIRHACGDDHPYAAMIELDLAELNLERGRYSAAEEFCRHALHVLRTTLGERHPAVARALYIQGCWALVTKDTSQARQSFDEAQSIAEATLDEDHPTRAEILGTAAALENSPRTFKRGVLQYQRAIETLQQQLGAEHPRVAGLWLALGKLYIEVEQFDAASDPLQRCYAIMKERLPEFYPRRADALEAYAVVLEHVNPPRKERAATLREQAATIRRRHIEQDQVD